MNTRTLKILRYNPEADDKPYWGEFELDVEPTDRLLDTLNRIKWYHDGTLGVRRSCQHGICGSDAMVVNGQNMLACKVLMRDLKDPVAVAPMRAFNVIKDLIVDMEPFFKKYRSVMPYLVNEDRPPAHERLQSQEDRDCIDDTTKCILCGACTTACPSFWSNEDYVGPAALVQAHRFIFDSRDQAWKQRLDLLNGRDGVWSCRNIFNCTDACPRGIKVTKAISEVRQAMVTESRGEVDG